VPLEPRDIVEIQQLYAAYNQAADRGDGKAFSGCFTEDGAFDLGGTTAQGSEAIAEFGNKVPAAAPGCRHIATNLMIDGDGDWATGSAYLMLLTTTTSPARIVTTGAYEDRLLRTAEGWRFTERRFAADSPHP
jgi:uncharacterized protein (TIGR02246 family)